MALFPLVSPDETNPLVKSVFDRLRGRWGAVLNIYRVLGWAPTLLKGWAGFAWTLRFELGVSRKLRELMVIRIAQICDADYEYAHHLAMAREAGVSGAQVDNLANWRKSGDFDEQEILVLQLAEQLALSNGASRETMAQLQELFSEQEVVELVVTGSFYCGVARIVNSFGVELEDGHQDLRARDV